MTLILHRLTIALATGLGLIFSSPFSFADAQKASVQENGWATKPFGIDVDRRGSATEDYTIIGWRLDPVQSREPHIRFNCSGRAGLVAVISPTPEKQSKQGQRVDTRLTKTRLAITGRKAVMVNWLHVRETGIMQTRENQVAKQIFNAVITQTPIEIKLPLSKGKRVFTPPPPDAEFKKFMKACQLGS